MTPSQLSLNCGKPCSSTTTGPSAGPASVTSKTRSPLRKVSTRHSMPRAGALQELHPLRERQFGRVVDGVGRPAHVRLPRVRARLAPAAGLLLAAEGSADLGSGRPDVHV